MLYALQLSTTPTQILICYTIFSQTGATMMSRLLSLVMGILVVNVCSKDTTGHCPVQEPSR